MPSQYQIRMKDTAGALIGVITEWDRMTYVKRVNGVNTMRLELDGDSALVSSIDLDVQFEVWRENPEGGIALYKDFEGFHRTSGQTTNLDGRNIYVSHVSGYDDLLARRVILYSPGSAQASKSAVGETVMKEFVDENAGPGATSGPRLLASGVTTGLSIQADGGAGTSWTGARSYRNLLEVLQEVSRDSAVDFSIEGIGAALFEFQAKAAPFGDDRSTAGLDPATGLNGAGNAPAIFSLVFGNMALPEYGLARANEATAVIVLGQGQGADRLLVQRTDPTAIADSPWNRREIARQGNFEPTAAGLNSVGDATLEEFQKKETFNYDIIEGPAFLYGREWFLGDLVTARYLDIERDKKIVEVQVRADQGREDINVVLSDVP